MTRLGDFDKDLRLDRRSHSVGKSLKKVSISQCAKSQSNIFGAFMNKKNGIFGMKNDEKKLNYARKKY